MPGPDKIPSWKSAIHGENYFLNTTIMMYLIGKIARHSITSSSATRKFFRIKYIYVDIINSGLINLSFPWYILRTVSRSRIVSGMNVSTIIGCIFSQSPKIRWIPPPKGFVFIFFTLYLINLIFISTIQIRDILFFFKLFQDKNIFVNNLKPRYSTMY